MNILTIDFDWIMSDIIECYNDDISTGGDYEEMWEDIKRRMPTLNYNPNMELFGKVEELCKMFHDRLYKITNHQQVVPYVGDGCDVLINMDHHHDYYKASIRPAYDCSNWARYLHTKKMMRQFIWIGNPTSHGLHSLDEDRSLVVAPSFEPMDTIRRYKIDKCILCQSPEWLSPEVNQFWDIWTSTLDFIEEK